MFMSIVLIVLQVSVSTTQMETLTVTDTHMSRAADVSQTVADAAFATNSSAAQRGHKCSRRRHKSSPDSAAEVHLEAGPAEMAEQTDELKLFTLALASSVCSNASMKACDPLLVEAKARAAAFGSCAGTITLGSGDVAGMGRAASSCAGSSVRAQYAALQKGRSNRGPVFACAAICTPQHWQPSG